MLFIPTTEEKVTLVVPTVRRADIEGDEGTVRLGVYDSTSHEVFDGEVTATNITPFSLTIPDFVFGLSLGQYVYEVWDDDASEDDTPLSVGILQVGLVEPETQAHNYQPEVIRYER